jgi:hypothetical protein
MTVKGSLREIELTHEPLANAMRVKVMMPGWFYREPEFRAIEREQFLGWIIQRQQSIGRLERHSWGIQYVVQLKVIPRVRLELLRNDSASKWRAQDSFTLCESCFRRSDQGLLIASRASRTRSNTRSRSLQNCSSLFHNATPGRDVDAQSSAGLIA